LIGQAKTISVVEAEARQKKNKTRLQGLVVRKPINANPRLKVNRGFYLAR